MKKITAILLLVLSSDCFSQLAGDRGLKQTGKLESDTFSANNNTDSIHPQSAPTVSAINEKKSNADSTSQKNLFTNITQSITPELQDLVDEITNSKPPFIFTGYLDAYYFKNLNDPKNGLNTGLSGAARAFDQKENQFQLGLVQTKFNWSRKKVDAVVDITFGPNADLANYGNKIGPLGVNVGSSALSLKQANITYKLNNKNFFTIGQFGTHIGYEVIEASINYHYSLSNLFNNGPFYHQGLKYIHTFNDKFSVMAGVVNNWDNLYDNNRFKTIVAQISFAPKKGYSFWINYIGGNEDNLVDTSQNISYYENQPVNCIKQMLDFVANMQITKKLYIGINAAIGAKSNQFINITDTAALKKLGSKNWGGAAAYVNYDFTSKISFGVRAELFDNTSGIQYIGDTDVQSYTASMNIKLDNDLVFKPECRLDIYKYNSADNGVIKTQQFMNNSGNYSKNSQITIGAAVIYKF